MDETSSLVQADPITRLSPPMKDDVQLQQVKYNNFYSPHNNDFYTKFHYSKLDENSIRLLRIKPLNPDEDDSAPISCDLLNNVSLPANKDSYTTISYCAGDPKKVERVNVNGIDFNAFCNLGHALRQARHFWKDKYDKQELLLWADQICINQSDHEERSQQVSLMGDIYALASQVLVCLSSKHDPAGGIDWFLRLSRIHLLEHKFSQESPPGYEIYDDNIRLREFFVAKWDNEDFHLGWDAFIRTVLTSPW
ncbi:uncharacterized protein LY89DRAFT_741405 [Mollisia scopiformis]|uniref:Heterokaryon incompatibility domain-containing protein n=1 Tax=Mollisia scopiformis TaxID=149040 RepID=A0A132B9Q7_MOLSC|nr:uncharacterized protein LY89DRAFT_741405 [Mollisia scopiformis]KUJ09111.1 hypothetical protein LY89DRAFT_741405 [Mollisia scopiformis]